MLRALEPHWWQNVGILECCTLPVLGHLVDMAFKNARKRKQMVDYDDSEFCRLYRRVQPIYQRKLSAEQRKG